MNIFHVIEHVELEYRAARTASARLIEEAEQNPTVLNDANLRPRDLRDCLNGLEKTYVIRLYAEFEAALRRYWRWVRSQTHLSRMGMYQLLRNVADKQHVPNDVVDKADRVRDFRNSVVHLSEGQYAMTFEECRAALGHFLSNLDHRWLFHVSYA